MKPVFVCHAFAVIDVDVDVLAKRKIERCQWRMLEMLV